MLDYQAYLSAARRSYVEQDPSLASVLATTVAPEWREWMAPRLAEIGRAAATRWNDLATTANEQTPRLRSHNRWGERIDAVEVHPAYDQLAREVYEAGVVWPRFNPVLGGQKAPWGVVFTIGYLLSQAEQGLFCPVCLTAGTAWLIERFSSDEQREAYLPRVAAQSYDDLWEGAMFLTEKAGGSDVGAVETTAKLVDGEWRLAGDKWFSSNGGRARAMMVLARPEGAAMGTRGLGLFLVPLHLADGSRNAIRFHRLKDKLGTKSMPSAELTFEGAVAYPVGDITRGFNHMAEMLNLSRLYNAVASVGNMRRTLNEAIAYTHARTAFGHVIDNYPLVRAKLIELSVEQEASFRLVFEAIAYLDRLEAGQGREDRRDEAVLRVLTPMAKFHTGREAVDAASAAAEILGGNGYIEDWPIARFFRDAQVLPIWEGTTNILLLDVLRAFAKESAGQALLCDLGERLGKPVPAALAHLREVLVGEVADLEHHLAALGALPDPEKSVHVKGWADRAVRAFQGVLLLATAAEDVEAGRGRGLLVLSSFVRRHYTPTGAAGWRTRLTAPAPHLGFEAIVRGEAVSAAEAIELLRGDLAAAGR